MCPQAVHAELGTAIRVGFSRCKLESLAFGTSLLLVPSRLDLWLWLWLGLRLWVPGG